MVRTLPGGALALFVLLASAYVGSIGLRASWHSAITGDEPFYLLTTQSLLQDGDLDLNQQYERHSYESFFDHPDGLWQQSAEREDGARYSPHDPGLSILLIPGFAIAGLLGAQVQLLIMAALTFALTYLLIARITGEAWWSWLSVAVVGSTATAFVYATEVYPEMPAALMLMVSLLLLPSRSLQPGSRNDGWRALLLAALLSAMVWLGIKYAPLAGLVAGWALWQMDARGRVTLLTAGGISAVYFVGFHLRTFGALTPYSVGLVYAGDSTISVMGQHFSASDRVYRVIGLFIDQRFGIGRWAPVLLMALPALAWLWSNGSISRLVLTLIAIQLFLATFVAVTMMGWWFPGRTMITVLPLFALPLALLQARLPQMGRVVVGLLAIYTVSITIALAIAGHTGEISIAVDPFNMRAFLWQIDAPVFPDYRTWTVQTWLLTGGWLLAVVALVRNLPGISTNGFCPHMSGGRVGRWLFHRTGILPRMMFHVPRS
jgi:hypothetical protein